MNELLNIIDLRYVVFGATAGFVLLFVVMFVLRFLRGQRRDRYIKAVLSKTEGAAKKAQSVILDAEARAMKNSGRDTTYPLEAINPRAIKRDLKRAGLTTFWPAVYLVAAGLAYVVAWFIIAAPIYPTWGVALSIYLPVYLFVRFGLIGMKMEAQRMKMMAQLVVFIESVQRAVTVGTSTDEAVGEAIKETEAPLQESLTAIKELLDLGYDFVEAINLAADRINLPEFDIFAASLTAQSTTGGSVGDVLKEVVEIARSRMTLTKKIATMTAEGRFNALLLGGLPIGLTIYLRYAQPDYAKVLWEVPVGQYIYFAQLGMAVLGAWLAMKIAKITV